MINSILGKLQRGMYYVDYSGCTKRGQLKVGLL